MHLPSVVDNTFEVRLSGDGRHRLESSRVGLVGQSLGWSPRSPRWRLSRWSGTREGVVAGLWAEEPNATDRQFPFVRVSVEDVDLSWSRSGRSRHVRVEGFRDPSGRRIDMLHEVVTLRAHPVPFSNAEQWPRSFLADVDVMAIRRPRASHRSDSALKWPDHVRIHHTFVLRGVRLTLGARPLRVELLWSEDDGLWRTEAWELDRVDFGSGELRTWCGWPGRRLIRNAFTADTEGEAWNIAGARLAAARTGG